MFVIGFVSCNKFSHFMRQKHYRCIASGGENVKRPVECLCFLYSIGVPVIKDADHSGAFYGTGVQSCSAVL